MGMYGSATNMMPQQHTPPNDNYKGRGMSGQYNHFSNGHAQQQQQQQFANISGIKPYQPPEKKRQASYKSHDRKASRAQYDNVAILKLTSVNLEKHNKLFPPKRKQVKEVMLTKIILTNCVVAY